VTCLLLRLIYSPSDQDALIKQAIDAARAFFQKLLAGQVVKQEREAILGRANVRLSHFMMRAALSCKDECFSDEEEWRLVTGLHPAEEPSQNLLKLVGFRSGGGIVKPFLELPSKPSDAWRLPLTKVLFGPTLRPSLTREALNFFMTRQGYATVSVDGSCVPLQA
jgi:hypothetical protein